MKVDVGLVTMEKKGQTFVVGVKLSTASREVLTWTLMKVARPGDYVIALYAVSSPTSNTSVSSRRGKKENNQLASTFDGMMGVHEAFCSLKQVGLEVKIAHGPVRKVLLEEAKLFRASKLILGTSKRNALVSPISLAKYCAQRLMSTCSVLVVDHGKVVFQKDGLETDPGTIGASILSVSKALHESLPVKQNSKQSSPDTTPSSPRDSDSGPKDSSTTDTQSDHGGSATSSERVVNENNQKKEDKEELSVETLEDDVSARISMGEGEPISSFEVRRSFDLPKQSKLPRSSSETRSGQKSSLASPLLHKELSPGWPLLHKAISVDKAPSRESPAQEMAVVQWALGFSERREQAKDEPPSIKEGTKETSNKYGNLENSNQSSLAETQQRNKIESGEENLSLTEKLKLLCKRKTCKRFTYEALQSATSNFSTDNLIGKGGCSRVYRGILSDGQSVAVKFLNHCLEAEQELLLEVEIMLALQHKNIVSLVGYCICGQERLLVYNFVSRGNLEANLHVEKGKVIMPWKERSKVAIGVAKALGYLHDRYPRPVIHRDVKSSNILLSDDLEPQLSDFGLAKWAPTSSSWIICNDVFGTFGYLAPEYFMYGKVNEKTDIYSFGVVLLELISGKKPINTKDSNQHQSLVAWAKPLLEDGSIRDLVDPNLENAYDEREMQRMILAAALCIRRAPRFRPRMIQILKLLQGEGDNPTHWARHQLRMSKNIDNNAADEEDEGNYESPDIRTHLSLAMLGVEDDVGSFDSSDQSSVDHLNGMKTLEDYLGGRFSHSSS